MTPQLMRLLSQSMETDYGINPLKPSKQADVLMTRQVLFLILFTKFHLSFQTISDWTGWNRTTVYHSCNMVRRRVKQRNRHYIDTVNRWKLLISKHGDLLSDIEDFDKGRVTAEAAILNYLKDFDTEESLEILNNITNSLKR